MARERRAESAIEIAFLSATSVDLGDPAPARLLADLPGQGIEPAAVSLLSDPDPVRLRSQLAAVLAGPARPPGARDESPPAPIALLAADVVVNATALGAVLDDPRVRTGALVTGTGASLSPAQAARRHLHLGVLKVDGADRPTAAALVRDLPADGPGDVLLELTRALTAAGVDVRPVPLGGYAWARPQTPAEVSQALAAADAVDERTVRLREAARGGDGFYSTFVLRRVSWRFTALAERSGLTPNQVTLISFGLGLVAAGFLAVGSRPWSVAGALLLQFCLIVDCVDGELARYRRRFSRFGAWLDATTDRVKEFAAIGALAVAAARHDQDLWWLVSAAIALQTFRNLFDLGWALQRRIAATAPGAPGPARPEWVASATWLRPPAPQRSSPGALSWVRRVGHFPIGERFLLISLGAALWTSRGTLIALLVAGLVSAAYMLAAFAVRGRPAIGSGRPLAGLIDAGPVLGAMLRQSLGARASRAAVLLPALVAVAELGMVQWLAVDVAGARGLAGAVLVAACAVAHYQHAYGVREDRAEEAGGFVIGTDLRLVALVLVVVVPALLLDGEDARSWADTGVWALAALVAVSATLRSRQAWTGSGPAVPGTPGGQDEASVDRMRTSDADAGNTAPHQAIGGVR